MKKHRTAPEQTFPIPDTESLASAAECTGLAPAAVPMPPEAPPQDAAAQKPLPKHAVKKEH